MLCIEQNILLKLEVFIPPFQSVYTKLKVKNFSLLRLIIIPIHTFDSIAILAFPTVL